MLVVGIGNSAVDIVPELSRKGVAEKVFISTRSGAWVAPKHVFGRSADTVFKTNPPLPLGLWRRLARPSRDSIPPIPITSTAKAGRSLPGRRPADAVEKE